ncbi:hypothetical protein D3C86_1529090 [compost metagenome]
MPPLRREPGVVVVEPTHDTADVPRSLDRIKPIRRARNPGAERYNGAFDHRPEMLGALGKTQGQQAATQGIDQAVARGVQRLLRLNLVVQNVVGNILQDLVVVGSVVQVDVGAHVRFTL